MFSPKSRSERGAVLVEAAIAIPLLLFMIFGGIELGSAWEARSAATSGVRTGLLRSASLGNRPEADLRTLQSIVGEIGTENVDGISWIVIFNADTTDIDDRIAQCAATAGAAGGRGLDLLCSAYDTADLQAVASGVLTQADFDTGGNGDDTSYTCDPTKMDLRFCSGSRLTAGAINIGVAIEYNHEWTTGVLPSDGLTYTEFAISSTLTGDQAAPPVVSSSVAEMVLAGGANKITPPGTTSEGTQESDTESMVWAEKGPLTLGNDLVVNLASSGTYAGNFDENAVIPAGTEVCSYYVQIDRVMGGRTTGSQEFANAQILGVIYKGGDLVATDGLLGSDGTTYEGSRGAEGSDDFEVSLSDNSISWDVYVAANNYTDDFRVLTTC